MAVRPRKGWFVVWYLCIGVGFVLLALRAFLLGVSATGVALRLVIALGFLLLAWFQNRERGRG